MAEKKKKVVFLHPDLGIGGAERLIIDAAIASQCCDHQAHIVTAHFDNNHCFSEVRNSQIEKGDDKTNRLFNPVVCVGDWLPRSIFGGMAALCAYIRMIYAAIWLCLFAHDWVASPDVIVVDQVSACIPFLKLLAPKTTKIVFYCHFPDLLLTKRGDKFLKNFYRGIVDTVEEYTTGMADQILVNSKFTGGIFAQTFKTLSSVKPEVLYPSLNTKNIDKTEPEFDEALNVSKDDVFRVLSINRYERKKNLNLAIKAFARFLKEGDRSKRECKLYMAGGYDYRVKENVEHFEELSDLAKSLGIELSVEMMVNLSDAKKIGMLKTVDVLLYTPSGEHFGIVPIEAMHQGLPVIAVNDGAGPCETVVDGVTGFLRSPDEEDFAAAIGEFYENPELKRKFGESGQKRVRENFSFEKFREQLHKVITN